MSEPSQNIFVWSRPISCASFLISATKETNFLTTVTIYQRTISSTCIKALIHNASFLNFNLSYDSSHKASQQTKA